MIVYRCTLKKWANDITGSGAFLYGGRWNNPGKYLVYTAENNVLAAFEVALRVPLEHISKNYVMVPIEIPDKTDIMEPVLPGQWHLKMEVTRSIGELFVNERKYLLMKVPSALISDSFNYLINPNHALVKKVTVLNARPILFDKRLLEMIRSKKN
jgi:RES domain-containing protein